MSDYSCDALIIGSGQAGNPLAKALAEAGQTVILVEEAHLGGSCLNYGCVPTKTMLASAERMHQVCTADALGIRLGGVAQVDMPAVVARKDALLEKSRRGLRESLAPKHDNITVLHGQAAFVAPRKVRVQETATQTSEITAKQVFINTGTRAAIPDVPGLADVDYLTTTELLDVQEVPEHLLILGGGYIGLEFGQMFRRFGSRVTIIDTGSQVLEREDDDVCECLQTSLEADGIEFFLDAKARHVSRSAAGQLTITLDTKHGERRLHGTHLLVATGRQPNSDQLNLAVTGIKTDEKGYIQVDSRLQTNVRGVYALGDVHGGPQFTHLSYDDFRVVRDNLLHQGPRRSAKQRPLPYCVFTDPQLGRIGLSETQAKDAGVAYRVAKIPLHILSRAQHTGQHTGFWKVLVGADDRILGAALLGPEAGDIMTILQVAMAGRLRYQQLQNMVIAHPIWAEGLNVVWRDLK
ncbi:FAD-containing oxidoreductase [Hymenobacter sp. HMF4947]|uniref:FAD-containing oxidoreductase n=1 Tax=Hymenobacter ginkgonis TaxID=2682976 RepID=A0A7K1TKC6_9BACT|nr:mercuric reductase [Hymenobacter ginkgonis]MVN78571.1 FAD-containing oxidoreductase [Hymenobacter ginkgonis]